MQGFFSDAKLFYVNWSLNCSGSDAQLDFQKPLAMAMFNTIGSYVLHGVVLQNFNLLSFITITATYRKCQASRDQFEELSTAYSQEKYLMIVLMLFRAK